MRNFLAGLILSMTGFYAQAQDPGMQAAQQAQMAAQQATEQAQMAAQQAVQQAMSDMQLASQNAMNAQQQAISNSWPQCDVSTPTFSLKTGTYSSALTVTIRASRRAAIFYTIDGWTPTKASTLYTGPITIDSTTTLQAMAVAPCRARSRIVTAVYTLDGVKALPTVVMTGSGSQSYAGTMSSTAAAIGSSGKLLLAKGTPVPLAFAEDVSSRTARVGEKISLTLTRDLKAGNSIVANKGATSVGTITEVDRPHMMGSPGEIVFVADSLQAGGATIKLRGTAAKQGQDEVGKASALMVFPVPMGLFVHGKNAEIKQGAAFTAFVDADTVLPANQ